MAYLRKDMTPCLPLENANLCSLFLYFARVHLSELRETDKVKILLAFQFKARFFVFISLPFTVNSITCEVLTFKARCQGARDAG